MPDSVLRRATERAEELEALWGKIADRNSHQQEDKDSAAADASNDAVSGSETESQIIKNVVGLVKKIPEDVSDDAGHSSLLLLWEEAKRMLGTSVDSSKLPVVVEQKQGIICA